MLFHPLGRLPGGSGKDLSHILVSNEWSLPVKRQPVERRRARVEAGSSDESGARLEQSHPTYLMMLSPM